MYMYSAELLEYLVKSSHEPAGHLRALQTLTEFTKNEIDPRTATVTASTALRPESA